VDCALADNPRRAKDGLIQMIQVWVSIATTLIAIAAFAVAGWQAWIANDVRERSLRAYIGPTSASIERVDKENPVVVILLKNFGSTPASRVRVSTFDAFVSEEEFIGWRLGKWRDAARRLHDFGRLDPGQPTPAVISILKFTEEHEKAIREGESNFVVKTIVLYQDAFKKSWTRTFVYYLPRDLNKTDGTFHLALLGGMESDETTGDEDAETSAGLRVLFAANIVATLLASCITFLIYGRWRGYF
jgi:hypothetical protein